ncbi:MAG: sigma-70 family RNA polymerase sigma factor [Lachnospiraceae bacterium]|nr:sigma-70 family RNA polymerase sigma factor [Lachnospiraceae bacterium]
MDERILYEKIYRYCYYRLGRAESAEDITQEAFLRLWESKDYQEQGKALQYLYTTARHLCIDEYRRCRAQPLTEEMEEQLAAEPGVEPETRLALRQALATLSGEEQELLALRYGSEMPVGEMAQLFQLSRFALRRRINAALEKLRVQLG